MYCVSIQVLSHNNGNVAGQDVTEAFYGLHLHEVLLRPQYQRLQIGLIEGEEPQLHGNLTGEVSKVPYAEPSWLSEGYHSAYFKEVKYQFYEAHDSNSNPCYIIHRAIDSCRKLREYS